MVVEEDVLGLYIAMDDVFGVQVTDGADHLVEKSARDSLVQASKLQNLNQVVRRVFENKPRTHFRTVGLLVHAFLYSLVQLDYAGMLQLSQNTRFLVENALQDLLRVRIAFCGKLYGVELSVLRGEFDSE